MASSPRPANLNLNGGVKDLQVTNHTQVTHKPAYPTTPGIGASTYLVFGGVFHCTLKTVPAPGCTNKQDKKTACSVRRIQARKP